MKKGVAICNQVCYNTDTYIRKRSKCVMKKRMFSFLLALMLIVGLVPTTVVTANAVGGSKLNTSETAVKVLVEKQGFQSKVYEKNGKYYIGYGSIVKDNNGNVVTSMADAEKLFPDAITETMALSLVQNELKESIDKKINDFTDTNTIQLTQGQHDALAVYSHRVGTGWMSDTSNALNIAVRARKTGTEFIKAIVGQPSLDNLEALKVSMNLRLSEANMYLNGMYGYNRPGSMSYAVLDNNGTKELAIYETSKGYALNPSTVTGKDFFGWYVADGDGKPSGAAITKLTGDHYGKLIIAKFDNANAMSPVKYTINTSSLPSRNFYSAPMTRAALATATPWGVLGNNTTFTVSFEKVVDLDFKWVYGEGKNDKGQGISQVWVPLGDFSTSIKPTEKPVASATITTATYLYYGASLNSGYTGESVSVGQTYNVYATQEEKSESGNILWGQISVNGKAGWIDLKNAKVVYTNNTSTSPVGKNGKIINAEVVNVRQSADIGSAILTGLKRDTKVTILETKMNGENQWMRVRWSGLKDGYQEGWVYAYYIEVEGAPHSNPGNAANSGTVKYTGVVTSNINLNVRKSADVYAPKVRSLPTGTKIGVYEITTARGMKWGRIGEGEWVCLSYVKLTEVPNSGNNSNSGATSTTDIQATVTSTTLDVLKSYNNNSAKVGTLKKGDVVPVLERNTEKTGTGTRIWGRIKKDNLEGWINLAYADVKTVTTVVNPGNTGNAGSDNNTTSNANGAEAVIANCVAVNVRDAAGTANKLKLKLNQGTAVKVYEKKTVDNAPWSRITWDNGTSEGWVCMYYVEMKAASGTTGGNTTGNTIGNTNSNTISAVGTVNSTIALNVRAGAGLGFAKIGSLNKGAKVTVYEQVSADGMIWGRIPFNKGYGWICMSYINVDNVTSSGKGVMGTIARCFKAVNVRSAPGTNNALVATINVGSRVEVFEKKLYSGQYWGRVAQGWICMDYVLLDSELPPDTKLDETKATTAATNPTKETVNRDNEVLYTVKGRTTAEVEIHNDASATSLKVGSLKKGMELRILGIKINNAGELWGRVDDYAGSGWVNMKNVAYEVKGYVNTDEQPVYLNADAGSTIKGRLTLNTVVTIRSLTLNGSTVFGWVEDGLNGWIPMGRVSDDPVVAIPIYSDAEVNNSFDANISGKTNATIDVVDTINGSKVLFRVKAGSNVMVGGIRTDYGRVWGSIQATTTAGTVSGWADLSGVNYTVWAGVPSGTKVYNTKDLNLDDSNVFETIEDPSGAAGDISIQLCKISFDANGGRWGTVISNGKFVYLGTGVNVTGLEG